MASLSVFHYAPAGSALHRLNPLLKFLLFASINFCILAGRPAGLLLAALALASGYRACGRSLAASLSQLRPLWLMLVLLFLSRLGGPAGPVEGAIEAGRLAGLALAGDLFLAVTRPAELERLILRLPLGSAAPATLLRLTLNLIPQLLELALSMREALAARGFDPRRRPLLGLRLLAELPLRRALSRVDLIADALEARNFEGERYRPPLPALRPADAAALAAAFGLAGAVFLL